MNRFINFKKKFFSLLIILTLTFSAIENNTDIPHFLISNSGDEVNIEEQY